MGIEGVAFDGPEGVSPSFVESLYRQYRADRTSVELSWQQYFAGIEDEVSGPSWARADWPPADTDALTAARSVWTDCKARGFEVTYWQADERGRWQRRQ